MLLVVIFIVIFSAISHIFAPIRIHPPRWAVVIRIIRFTPLTDKSTTFDQAAMIYLGDIHFVVEIVIIGIDLGLVDFRIIDVVISILFHLVNSLKDRIRIPFTRCAD